METDLKYAYRSVGVLSGVGTKRNEWRANEAAAWAQEILVLLFRLPCRPRPFLALPIKLHLSLGLGHKAGLGTQFEAAEQSHHTWGGSTLCYRTPLILDLGSSLSQPKCPFLKMVLFSSPTILRILESPLRTLSWICLCWQVKLSSGGQTRPSVWLLYAKHGKNREKGTLRKSLVSFHALPFP